MSEQTQTRMKYVRVTLDADGREDEIHPMFDLVLNAPYIERATAMHWSYSGEELGIMHYIEGDATAFRKDIAEIPEVLEYDLTLADEGAFYVYILDSMNDPLRTLFDIVDKSPVVILPPVEYAPDGMVSYAAFGPAREIQKAIDQFPDPIDATITEVGSMQAIPELTDSILSDRQQDAVTAALALGYYDIPREASYEEIAEEIGCAPSTAAEHIQKAESKILRSVFDAANS